MTRPTRVRLSRRPGARLPDGCVSVAYPTRWANPHRPGEHTHKAHTEAVRRYREDLLAGRLAVTIEDVRRELADKTGLACWCHPDLPCHVDVLIEMMEGADQADSVLV